MKVSDEKYFCVRTGCHVFMSAIILKSTLLKSKILCSLLLQGQVGVVLKEIRRRSYSDEIFYVLRRDLRESFKPPDTGIALRLRPLRGHLSTGFVPFLVNKVKRRFFVRQVTYKPFNEEFANTFNDVMRRKQTSAQRNLLLP